MATNKQTIINILFFQNVYQNINIYGKITVTSFVNGWTNTRQGTASSQATISLLQTVRYVCQRKRNTGQR